MKNLVPVCIIIVLIVSFAACEIDKTDPVQERMEAFIEDVNAKNWSNLKSHTHPDAENYSQADSQFWITLFETAIPLTDLSVEDTTATFIDKSETIQFKAELKEDDTDDYKILKITRVEDGTEIFFNMEEQNRPI